MNRFAPLMVGSLLFLCTATPLVAQSPDRAAVERAQRALKAAGHDPGPVDGVMGARTRAALSAYQKVNGLGETGRLDEATQTKLGEPAQAPSASPQTRGSERTGGSEQTGGDARPNAVDPAQATKTGANASEGASYSRSTEKGQSTLGGTGKK
jgi:peptidoglycan hydrolase-like protein with peptidoglycan-binding domain